MPVLYRKYRPGNFSEVIGQEHIVRTLSNSLKNGRFSQAYLFTGPRGIGKTSVARIFAKRINCEKPLGQDACGKCPACQTIASGKSLDIIEIDAASNTGVDNIRDLRETVVLAPASLKFKIYIIDGAHMLSPGAWNALLKTLEEPPAHVIFILATTEIHKVPETILSRCQRFDFSRLPFKKIVEKLSAIAKEEKVAIEKEALEIIAMSAEGGLRDGISLLDQVMALEDKNITARETQEILGMSSKKDGRDFAEMILEKKSTEAIKKINSLLQDGYDLEIFAKTLVNYLRQLMLLKINPELGKFFSFEMTKEDIALALALAQKTELSAILSAINLFIEARTKISASPLPQLPLEIAAIKATKKFPSIMEQEICLPDRQTWNLPTGQAGMEQKKEAQDIKYEAQDANSKTQAPSHEIQDTKKDAGRETREGKSINLSLDDIKIHWKQLLSDIRPYNHSLSALLMSCLPTEISKNVLTLATPYGFYQDKLNDAKNRLTVEEVFSKILGAKILIRITLDKAICEKKRADEEIPAVCQQNPLLDDALEIIGGKIVE